MKDYHVHYYLDGCASADMTFPNIDKACASAGIDEITVLKHYSEEMPNGEQDWICWHRIKPEMWKRYLAEYARRVPTGTVMHSGVETELKNSAGDINIPLEEQQKIDMCALSMHYMISMPVLTMDLMIYPILSFSPGYNNDTGRRMLAEWREKVAAAGDGNVIAGMIDGYRNAVLRYPKVRTLAHMADGLTALRKYLVDVDSIGDKKITEMFEPLFSVLAEKGVLWELNTDEIHFPLILKRAEEMGVRFCATSDSHTPAVIARHFEAEDIIDSLGLTRGQLVL